MIKINKIILCIVASVIFITPIVSFPAKSHAVTNIVDSPGFLDNAWGAFFSGVVAVSAVAVTAYNDFKDEIVTEVIDYGKKKYKELSTTVKDGFRALMILHESGVISKIGDNIWDNVTSNVATYLGEKISDIAKGQGKVTDNEYSNPRNQIIDFATPVTINEINKATGQMRSFSSINNLTLTVAKYDSTQVVYILGFGGSTPLRYYTDLGTESARDIFVANQDFKFKSPQALLDHYSMVTGYVNDYVINGIEDKIYDPTLKRALETDIPRMKDAGLVLPMPEAYHPTTNQRLKVNDSTGAITLPDGSIYTGDVTWKAPPIAIGTDVVGNPAVGWSGTDVQTGAPTWTDIQTGITTGIGEGTIPGEVPGTGVLNPPKIPSKAIVWTPLIVSGSTIKEKFPFSIPWDLIKQLSVFNAEPEAPVFKVNVPKFLVIGEMVIPLKFNIDLSMFDPVANILRWGNTILFDIGLLLLIRKLLPE